MGARQAVSTVETVCAASRFDAGPATAERRRLAQQRRQKGASRVPYRLPRKAQSAGVDSNQATQSSRA
ncbi:hypothetical protein WR30_31140 [Burkholderia contaminans FFH2055]|nr:hypothetical protein WR30_31140 [Burkholderia contaminans FFH2055]